MAAGAGLEQCAEATKAKWFYQLLNQWCAILLKEQQEAGVNTYKLREVKDSERAHLKKATIIDPRTGQPTQRYVIAVNGIFNDVQAAAKYASQNYVATNGENGQPNGRVYMANILNYSYRY